jgi:hypothetical protein
MPYTITFVNLPPTRYLHVCTNLAGYFCRFLNYLERELETAQALHAFLSLGHRMYVLQIGKKLFVKHTSLFAVTQAL